MICIANLQKMTIEFENAAVVLLTCGAVNRCRVQTQSGGGRIDPCCWGGWVATSLWQRSLLCLFFVIISEQFSSDLWPWSFLHIADTFQFNSCTFITCQDCQKALAHEIINIDHNQVLRGKWLIDKQFSTLIFWQRFLHAATAHAATLQPFSAIKVYRWNPFWRRRGWRSCLQLKWSTSVGGVWR